MFFLCTNYFSTKSRLGKRTLLVCDPQVPKFDFGLNYFWSVIIFTVHKLQLSVSISYSQSGFR